MFHDIAPNLLAPRIGVQLKLVGAIARPYCAGKLGRVSDEPEIVPIVRRSGFTGCNLSGRKGCRRGRSHGFVDDTFERLRDRIGYRFGKDLLTLLIGVVDQLVAAAVRYGQDGGGVMMHAFCGECSEGRCHLGGVRLANAKRRGGHGGKLVGGRVVHELASAQTETFLHGDDAFGRDAALL